MSTNAIPSNIRQAVDLDAYTIRQIADVMQTTYLAGPKVRLIRQIIADRDIETERRLAAQAGNGGTE